MAGVRSQNVFGYQFHPEKSQKSGQKLFKSFMELCSATKTAWQAIGKVNYDRTEAEKGNVKFRRSLYYVRSMKDGDIITENDIRSVRPGFGLPPKFYDNLIGSKVKKSVEENTPVTLDSVDLVSGEFN